MAPIYPITVDYLPTVVICGHSNGDGWGASEELFKDTGDFACVAGGYPSYPNRPRQFPQDAYWKNIYVFTSSQPFPGAAHTPAVSSITTGEWLEMTIANPKTNGDPHPHAHPFNYANNRGACYPRYYYYAWKLAGFDGFHYTPNSDKQMGTLIGLEVPLMNYFRNLHGTQVGLIKVAFSSSVVLPVESGTDPGPWIDISFPGVPDTPASQFAFGHPKYVPSSVNPSLGTRVGYWDATKEFDWSPATDRLFQMTLDKIRAAALAMPAGKKMDLRMVVLWFGDNDASLRDEATIRASWRTTVLSIVKRLRQEIDDNEWSSLPAAEVKIVWPGIFNVYSQVWGSAAFMNTVLRDIARDDPNFLWLSSDAWPVLATDNYFPVPVDAFSHFGHTGYIAAARDIMAAYEASIVSYHDAIAEDDRLTVEEAVELVRITYDRGKTQSDLDRDTIVEYLNQSLRSMVNHLGHLAWWLEKRIDVTLTFDSRAVASFPRYVAHVTRIENPADGSQEIEFTKVGRGDGGRVLITIPASMRSSQGTYKAWIISWPPELLRDKQPIAFPKQFSDWLALETCMRIASSGTNVAAQALFAGRAAAERTRAQQVVGDERIAYRDQLKAAGEPRRRLDYGRN
jgi:hypothetical protein